MLATNHSASCSLLSLSVAVSVSLGAPREFLLRGNGDSGDKYCFRLGAGDVLVMRGSTQLHWMHRWAPGACCWVGRGQVGDIQVRTWGCCAQPSCTRCTGGHLVGLLG